MPKKKLPVHWKKKGEGKLSYCGESGHIVVINVMREVTCEACRECPEYKFRLSMRKDSIITKVAKDPCENTHWQLPMAERLEARCWDSLKKRVDYCVNCKAKEIALMEPPLPF